MSVIIPTRLTRPDLLLEAVSSVLRQTRTPAELIIAVDSDAVNAAQLADLLPLNSALRTRLVVTGVTGGAGVSAARNLGAVSATTEHLAFLDDDDYWLPDMLEFFWPLLPDVGLASFAKQRSEGTLVPEKVPPAHLHPRKFLVCNPGLRGSNLIVRRDLFHRVGGFAPDLPALNDLDFGFRLASQSPTRYVRSCTPRVVLRSHRGGRLTDRGSPAISIGVQRFWRRYAPRMTPREASHFWMRAHALWGLTAPSGRSADNI